MPNNRGGVRGLRAIPMYSENAQYNATINPQVPQGSPASFGTQVAKEMAGMGDTIGKWGTNLVDYAVKMQERDDNAFILEKDNEMRAAMTDLLYNPQNGLANTKGKNSFGVTQTYDEAVEKLTQDAMSNIGNPALQAKLQEHNMQWVNSLRNTIAKHEGGERFTYYSNNMTASALSAKNIGLQIGGVNGMQAGNAIIEGLRDTGKSLLGWDDTMADNWIRDQKSAIFDALIKDCIDRGDTAGQQALVDMFGGDVNGQSLLGAKSKLAVVQEQQDAYKQLEDAVKAHPEWVVNGVLDEAKVREWIENNYGQNAPDRIERVSVGGSYFQDTELNGLIDAAAQKYKVDPLLVAALASVESSGNQGTVSSVGAVGVMQLTDDTAKELGVDRNNKAQNVDGGTKYLKQMLDMFGGNVDLAIAAYNAGPGAVKDAGNKIPNFKETQNHVAKVKAEYERLKSQVGAAASVDVGSAIDKAWNDYEDKSVPLPEGTNGCAHAANYFAAYYNPWSKKQIEKGGSHMSYVPQLVKDAQESGAPGVEDFKEANLRKGDMIVYKAANDPEGMNHVVVYAGDGVGDYRFVGNSSRANNGQGGIVQGSDYRNMGSADNPLTPQYIIKTSPERNSGGRVIERKVSGYNPVMRDAMIAHAAQLVASSKSDKSRKIENYAKALYDNPRVQGAMTTEEIINEYRKLGGDPMLEQDVIAKVAYLKSSNRETQGYQRQEEQWDRTKRRWGEEDASRDLAAYMVKNPGATVEQILTEGKKLGISDKEYIAIRDSKGGAGARLKNAYAWAKDPDKEKAFNDTISGLKLNSLQKANIRIALNEISEQRMGKGEPPLSDIDVISEVKKRAGKMVINKGTTGIYGGEEITMADLPPGAELTEYGVLLNGYTMAPVRDDKGNIVDWKVMNAD